MAWYSARMRTTSRSSVVFFCSLAVAAALCAAAFARPAVACGGVVQPPTGTVAQKGQTSLIVVDGARTHVVLTINVPTADNAFGVLAVVPAQPVIDPNPVSTSALDLIEARTRPIIGSVPAADDGGGCACGSGLAGADSKGIVTGELVEIGPVTAQWVSGQTGNAVADWLTDNDFELPAGGAEILQRYTDRGSSFLAFKRNATAGTGAARIGVRFTLDGDHRAYALQMATLGAAPELALTIFVATRAAVGPDAPYQAVTVDQLDDTLLKAGDYEGAVRQAVREKGGKAFVVETQALASAIGTDVELAGIIPQELVVTRLSTIAQTRDLTDDVTFTADAPQGVGPIVGGWLMLDGSAPPMPRLDLALWALSVVLARVALKKRRAAAAPVTA